MISLAVSNEQSIIFLMWAHIGDHVSEYIVYVDNIETKIVTLISLFFFHYKIHFIYLDFGKRF